MTVLCASMVATTLARLAKAHLIAMLYGQFGAAQSLREIEAGLRSHCGKLYHLGGRPASRSTLAEANASRPVAIFAGVLSALRSHCSGDTGAKSAIASG